MSHANVSHMSAPTVDRALVLHVAKLASLSLSDAEADRLTHELASIVAYVEQLEELDTSDTPFGAVVKPLNFHRRTLKVERLKGTVGVLRVTALLETGDGTPFSLVVENYSRELVKGH